MSADYIKIYADKAHALGESDKDLVTFISDLPGRLRILDLGCGQGRDALVLARLGHHITGIDSAKTGIEQLRADASDEGLSIEASVADIVKYRTVGEYDIMLFDRILHMLDEEARLKVLARYASQLLVGGYVLIIDEPRNIPLMKAQFDADIFAWNPLFG